MAAEPCRTRDCQGGIGRDDSPMLPYVPAAVAEALLEHLESAAVRRGRATLAIPGGRSPAAVLTRLAGMCTPFLRTRLHLLWLDERAVPPGHPERNDAATLAAWDAGGPRPAWVHPMPAEVADLAAAADAYGRTLREASAGQAVDACLIGIGEDGHLASLFPRHPGLCELSDCFAVEDAPKPPPRRLTLSLPVVASAGLRVVLCLGAAKGWCWDRFSAGPDHSCPASLLPHPATVWFLDDAAVAGSAAGRAGTGGR